MAHILDDDCSDFPGFGFCKHCLKSGMVEVVPHVTVTGKMLDVRHTAFSGKIFEQSFLMIDILVIFANKRVTNRYILQRIVVNSYGQF